MVAELHEQVGKLEATLAFERAATAAANSCLSETELCKRKFVLRYVDSHYSRGLCHMCIVLLHHNDYASLCHVTDAFVHFVAVVPKPRRVVFFHKLVLNSVLQHWHAPVK